MRSEISLKNAAMINAVSKYVQIILQIGVSMVMARIISAEDYGIIAIVTVFTTFFSTIADMGFGSAVIQNKNLDNNDINNIFSFTCYIAMMLMCIFCLFSIPLSKVYNNHIYIPISYVLSISLFFNTINMIPNAMLMKRKKFLTVGYRNVIISVISNIIAIILALMGWRYYAIIMQSTISSIATFIWNYSNIRCKFRFRIEKDSINKVLNFSIFQFGFNMVQYFSRNMDNLLIGRFIGAIQLGYYDKAYRLTRYPVDNLTQIITPVLHPILSEYQSDKKYIYNKYISIVKILSLIGIYFAAVFFVCPKEIILVMYGKNWEGSAACLGIFAVTIWTQMVGSCSGAIFQSLGKTKVLFITGFLSSSITVGGFLVGVYIGTVEAIAASFSITSMINFIITTFLLVKKGFGYSYTEYLKSYLPECIIGMLMIATYILVDPYLIISNLIVLAIIKAIILFIIFFAGLIMTKQYKHFIAILK